jgi:ribosome-binding factor A
MARRNYRHNSRGQTGARTAKAGELIRRVIASELELIEDERLELVSLTGVEVDRDLHKAVVYFTTFDCDDDPKIGEAFEEYRGTLRHAVSQQTSLRRAPELEFRPDVTLRSAERIERLLMQEAHRPAGPEFEDDDGGEAAE